MGRSATEEKNVYRDTVLLENELYDERGRVWGNRSSNKRFRNCGSRTRKKRLIDLLHRTVVSPTIRKVLQPETRSLSGWDHFSFNMKISRKKEV